MVDIRKLGKELFSGEYACSIIKERGGGREGGGRSRGRGAGAWEGCGERGAGATRRQTSWGCLKVSSGAASWWQGGGGSAGALRYFLNLHKISRR